MSKQYNCRCSTCGAVSSPDIETNPGDYNPRLNFFPDPKNPLFHICSDCKGVYENTMHIHEVEDFILKGKPLPVTDNFDDMIPPKDIED